MAAPIDPGPLLEGIAALILAATGGVATIVGLLRQPKRNDETGELSRRITDAYLEVQEKALDAKHDDYNTALRHIRVLEKFCRANGLEPPGWETDEFF